MWPAARNRPLRTRRASARAGTRGGALGGDRINLETKNVYLWFKLPNTSLDFTVGLQNQSDAYAGLLFGAADMAGVFVNGKMEPVSYTLGWAKLYEFDSSKTDDLTFYLASAKFAPTKDVKLGLNFVLPAGRHGEGYTAMFHWIRHRRISRHSFFLKQEEDLHPGHRLCRQRRPGDPLRLLASISSGRSTSWPLRTTDVDIKGFAFDLRGDMNVGPGKAFLEGLYISGGDNTTKEIKSIVTFSDFDASPGGNSAFGRTDMSILLVNADDINCAQAFVGARATASGGSTSPALGGRGLTHIAAGYTLKLGDKLTAKVGAGYLRANKLLLSEGPPGKARRWAPSSTRT